MVKFWWRSGSRIRIRIATLVRRALAEVYTVLVLLVCVCAFPLIFNMKRKKLADCCGDLISCHVAQIGSSLILILVVLGRVIYVKGRVRSDQKLDRRPTLTTADP